MIVVSNAGPLIALAQIRHLYLLQQLYGQLYIPPAVRAEVTVSGSKRPGASEVRTADWIRVVKVRNTTAVGLLKGRLDIGESEAIVLAIEMQADWLLIDEARGRRVAEIHSINKTGTVGTVIMAKKQGYIAAVTPLLNNLRTAGFHMGDDLYHTARKLAGEA